MLLPRLVIAINRRAEIGHGLIPAMMTYLFLEILPRGLLGILLRGVFGKGNHFNPGLRFQPFFHLFAGVMRGLVLPEQKLALRAFRHCQLNGSQPDMTTTCSGPDFFEYLILYHFTF